ncbi:MAG: leucyl aminopeptidase family protein [Desulfurococcales archaeon]|nr:leucyl aminopeptidase family protein [Desulfurococcales archaeon]
MVLFTRPPRLLLYEGDPLESDYDALLVPVWQDEQDTPVLEGYAGQLDEAIGGLLRSAIEAGGFRASPGEVYKVYSKGKLIVFTGLGKSNVAITTKLENIRTGFARATRDVVEKRESLLACVGDLGDEVEVREAIIASLLAAYRLETFKSEKKRKLERVGVHGYRVDVDEVIGVVEGVYLARDVANAPPTYLSPPRLAEVVRDLFSGFDNVDVEVFDYERLVREGFGGIVNVGKGSEYKPRLIIIKYNGGDGEPIAVIGKTIVFDTGGINLKSSERMHGMRADKAGGAAALGIAWATAKLRLKLNLVVMMPAAINAPSGSAYLPSDVIRMWDGTMVEVNNTDAEGRLVLGDALAYAAKALNARELIDLATLTGAIVVALGPLIAGLFTRNKEMENAFLEAAGTSGEKVWPMPMEDAYKVYMTRASPLGDLANSGFVRAAGAIYGALFLERFTHGKPWVHLDIAGPGIGFDTDAVGPDYWPKGLAPGYGVRLILEYLKSKASR